MRFGTLFTAVSIVISGAFAGSLLSKRSTETIAQGLTAANYYGAPIAPWSVNHKAGWYYGSGTVDTSIPTLSEVGSDLSCTFGFLECQSIYSNFA